MSYVQRSCLLLGALACLPPGICQAQEIGALEPGGYLASPELRGVLADEVSGEIAKRHVAEISRYRRVRGGSPGSRAAAQYVRDVMLGHGYEDTVVESYLADGFMHYLGWRSPAGSRVEEAELWLLKPERQLLARFSDTPVSLMPYSSGGHAVGAIVDVGRGDRDDDYEGVIVRGRFVLATGGAGEVHRKAVVENFLRYVDTAGVRSPRGGTQLLNYRVGDYSGGSDHVALVDSSIGVPAVMLGFSPDRFHHTSEDTVDKVDPTSLKRVTLAAMASVLFMANAEDEEAMRLAGEVAGQGLARLGRMTKRNVHELHEALASGEAAFHERYRNGLAYTRLVGEVEEHAIRSSEVFASRQGARQAIARVAAGMDTAAETELDRLKLYYGSLCEMHGLEPGVPELTAAERKAQQVVPVRRFRGMMDRYASVMAAMVAKGKGVVWSSKDSPESALGAGYEESEHWYRERAESMGGLRHVFRNHLFELCNLMDGRRSVLDIRNALSVEFGETDLEFVMRYVSDLAKLGLVQASGREANQ